MKHTPGPWTFSKEGQYGDTRFYIAQQDDAPYTPNYSDVATLIAETVSSERAAIQEANARLIAAAPDLLAALQHISALEGTDSNEWDGVDRLIPEICDIARAAIAKAVQA